MFNKLSEKEILKELDENIRPKKITNVELFNDFYSYFLSTYTDVEITPDINIFSYENAIKENKYIEENYPDIADFLFIIGTTGQGDSWFINKKNGNILFYDHNQGKYSGHDSFIDLNISFIEFLQMAFLYRDLEKLLDDQDDEIEDQQINNFKETVNSIKSDLYQLYPFQYF
ncbi:hypothetical protein [Chryseobacterium taichungense]|uniref:hypothetical protein n=1 Tax=Chryseobacterium taichungense TaxID=295069 RepID=UPI0028A80FD5|nr:hypothetical protein [Chryseobacterium taichungense]